MEGLEISEVSFREVIEGTATSRMDPEYFNHAALNALALIKGHLKLGNLVEEGYRVVYETTVAIDRKHGEALGLPYFLQAADISTPFINAASMICVAQSDWERYPKGRIKPGELLIEVKGKAEKIAIVPEDFPSNTLVSGTCFKLTAKSEDDHFFMAAFLTCRYGQILKDRLKSNLLVSYLAKDDLYGLPIPNISAGLKAKIRLVFAECFAKNRDSAKLMTEAEMLLNKALGLENWQASEPLSYVRRSTEAFAAGRLDAEHFQEGYYKLKEILNGYSGGKRRLSDLCADFVNGAEIREYMAYGTPYLRIGDIKNLAITPASVVYVDPSRASPELNKVSLDVGDVLISRSGSLAVAAVVESEWRHALISSHLIRLRISDTRYDPYYLALYLSAMPGRKQIMQWSNGGVQPEISQPNLGQIIVPLLASDLQQDIRKKILQARIAENTSQKLLDAAKRAVEIAIESSEGDALAFLDQTLAEAGEANP